MRKIVGAFLIGTILLLFTCPAFAVFPPDLHLDVGRYNAYQGTIDGKYKIQMLLFPEAGKIVGNYYYETYEAKIKLSGYYDGNKVVLYEYDGNGVATGKFVGEVSASPDVFTGVWQGLKDNSKYGFEVKLRGTFPGHADNIYSEAGGTSTEAVENFAKELKNDILNRNKDKVAAKIAYPLKVYVDGQRVTVSSEQEFVEQFDKIFYDDYVRAIGKCVPLNMSSSYRGIMFGGKGQIWLNYVAKDVNSEFKLKVTALNNRPDDMEYFLRD